MALYDQISQGQVLLVGTLTGPWILAGRSIALPAGFIALPKDGIYVLTTVEEATKKLNFILGTGMEIEGRVGV
jgi:hypothetical protein